MRRAARRDGNEADIFEAFEGRGASVLRMSGAGQPDAVVFYRGSVWLVEVKQKAGKLKPAQVRFQARWTGPAVHIVRSVEDALALLSDGKETHPCG